MTHSTGQPHEMTPEEVVAWRATVWPLLHRLCLLQEEVATRAIGFDTPNDCFCGLGGLWPNAAAFRSDQAALDFIEETVRARLGEMERAPGPSGPGG